MVRAVDRARRFSVAPMMEWTDRHCRFFHRRLTREALLYTEMVTAEAVLHGVRERLIGFDPSEQPVALQLGGSDPARLAEAAAIGAETGYDEINLNVGCPSDRVQSGRFGACLMAEPDLVARCVAAMRATVDIPVTVKCRIGIDGRESYADLLDFADRVAGAGCDVFIVHARIAVLDGLSPKQNRDVPPLRYEDVYRLKQERPDLTIAINGGIREAEAIDAHLACVDGVMLGREAYQNPWFLGRVDSRWFGRPDPCPDEHAAVRAMVGYIDRQVAAGGRMHAITRHMTGLFQGRPGARAWRRYLSENGVRPGATSAVLTQAAALVASDTSSDLSA